MVTTATTTTDKYYITPTTYNSRWIPKVEDTEEKRRRSGWTEVISRHNKRHVYNSKLEHDPFAGMKSCVDYQQEIERIKQIVPKVVTQKPTHYPPHYSRSTSPDTTHSSDSESSLPESVITEQEKARFLAFVRSWTGDWKGNHFDDQFMDNSSLWAEPSPWNYHPTAFNNNTTTAPAAATTSHYHLWHSQPVQNQSSYNHWQNQQPIINRHGQHPIGMGRKKH